MARDRWATFDCYGTLIDWNGGIRGQLARVFGEERADALLVRYHGLEPELEADGTLSYREVLTEAMRRLGAPPDEEDALAQSLPSWQPFPEVPGALMAARGRGWKLAILSNTDRDYIESSLAQLGVPFELAIVASEIGSYKPALGHWQTLRGAGRQPARRARRGQPLPRHRPGQRARGCPRSGSTAWARPRGRRRRASCPI